MTDTAVSVARTEAVPSPDEPTSAPPDSERWRPDRRTVGLTLGLMVVTGVVLFELSGYIYGYSDHTLLMVKGIHWADHSAFQNDWFNQRAPQPHWLFDIVTFAGAELGQLPVVYFLYWIATLAAFSYGCALLARHWLAPNRLALVIGVAVLAAAGPKFALGDFLPLESQALPNLLGGCLAFAALAALIVQRHRLACLLAFATGLVHVQHGLDLAVILMAISLIGRVPKNARRWLLSTAFALVVMSVAVSALRGLASGNADMIEACKVASIGHCNANAWSWPVVRDGLGIVAAAAAVAALRWREWRVLVPVIVLPAVGVTLGFFADRLDWGSLGEAAQRLFVYRLMSLLVFFVPWLVVLLAAGRERRFWRAGLRALAAGGVAAFWMAAVYSITANAVTEHSQQRALGFGIGVLLSLPMLLESLAEAVNLDRWKRWFAAPVAAAVVGALVFGGVAGIAIDRIHPPLHLGLPDDGQVAIGRALEAHLPVGSVLAHPPEMDWVRLFSRRAVVGNCRAAPYGGKAWYDYKARLAALGVDTRRIYDCNRKGYERLTVAQVRYLRAAFGATHVALLGADPKVPYARGHWKLAWYSGPGTEPWWVFEIPEPGKCAAHACAAAGRERP